MGRYAHRLQEHIEEFRPALYRELQQEGRLQAFCLAREEEALDQKERMIRAGMHDWEAEEVIIRDLLQL